jgi:hypothetical protein
MSAVADPRARATAILSEAWTGAPFRNALGFCVGLHAPEDIIAAMVRGYRPAVRRDLMGEAAADAFIAAWDAAAAALGVASRAHLCMPKGHDGMAADPAETEPTQEATRPA